MKSRFAFIIALVLFGATVLSIVPVSAPTVGNGLYGQYWKEDFFGHYLPPYPGCYSYAMPLPLARAADVEQIDSDINNPPPSWRPFGLIEFSVKWSGYIHIPSDGTYQFRLYSDDGSWLLIDGELVINNGGVHPPAIQDGSKDLVYGAHEIIIDFYETCDVECGIVFSWKPPGASDWTVVPSDYLIPEKLPNPTVPEFSLALPMVVSLAAAALFIGKRRWLKTTL